MGSLLPAQTPGEIPGRRADLGLGVGLLGGAHNTSFSCIEGNGRCGTFSGNNGINLCAQLFADIPVEAIPGLWFSPHLLLNNYSVTLHSGLKADSTRRVDGTYIGIMTQQHFAAALAGIGFSPSVMMEIAPGLRIGVSPSATYLFGRNRDQTEEIVSPSGAVYNENGRTVRPLSGFSNISFNTWSFDIGAVADVRWSLGSRLTAGIELGAWLPLNSLATGTDWRTRKAGASATLSYLFGPAQRDPGPVSPVVRDSTVQPPPTGRIPMLTATLVARGVDSAGREYDDPVIEIEEAIWKYSIPLIPYIFFDSASSQIPVRYTRFPDRAAASAFLTSTLQQTSALEIHREMLNIIGERLRNNPAVRLTVAGSLSSDERSASNAREMAMDRAERVREYLVNIWGIASGRISTTYTLLPSQPSTDDTREGREENRRTEFIFTDPAAAGPVVIRRLAKVATPPAIRFVHEIIADTTVMEWNVTVEQGGRQLLRFEGDNTTGTLKQSKLWPLGDLRVARDTTAILYRLYVRDVIGQTASVGGTFHVRERIRPRPADSSASGSLLELDLVGFTYNSTELVPTHRTQLEDAARSLTGSSLVQITGYTDKTGDPAYNQRLSLVRAKSAQDIIRRIIRGNRLLQGVSIVAEGLGSQEQIFDNHLPEGRLLSRMVRVMISRPAWSR